MIGVWRNACRMTGKKDLKRKVSFRPHLSRAIVMKDASLPE